jgi:hypothetical protein
LGPAGSPASTDSEHTAEAIVGDHNTKMQGPDVDAAAAASGAQLVHLRQQTASTQQSHSIVGDRGTMPCNNAAPRGRCCCSTSLAPLAAPQSNKCKVH